MQTHYAEQTFAEQGDGTCSSFFSEPACGSPDEEPKTSNWDLVTCKKCLEKNTAG